MRESTTIHEKDQKQAYHRRRVGLPRPPGLDAAGVVVHFSDRGLAEAWLAGLSHVCGQCIDHVIQDALYVF
jgi:hypothetical protein